MALRTLSLSSGSLLPLTAMGVMLGCSGTTEQPGQTSSNTTTNTTSTTSTTSSTNTTPPPPCETLYSGDTTEVWALTSRQAGAAVAVDGDSGVYVARSERGNSLEATVQRISADGALLESAPATPGGGGYVRALEGRAEGGLVALTQFDWTTYGDGQIEGESQLVVSALDAQVQQTWERIIRPTAPTMDRIDGIDLTMLADGASVVAATALGDVILNGATLPALGVSDLLLVRFSPTGEVDWSLREDWPSGVEAGALGTGADDGLFVAGGADEAFSVGGLVVQPSDSSLFVAKLDGADGAGQWSALCEAWNVWAKSIAESPSGTVYVAGLYEHQLQCGAVSLTQGIQSLHGFVAAFDATGLPLWLEDLGENDLPTLHPEARRGPWITAAGDDLHVATSVVQPQGNCWDGMLLLLGPTGTTLGQATMANMQLVDLAVDAQGHSLTTGHFREFTCFGTTTLLGDINNGVGWSGYFAAKTAWP